MIIWLTWSNTSHQIHVEIYLYLSYTLPVTNHKGRFLVAVKLSCITTWQKIWFWFLKTRLQNKMRFPNLGALTDVETMNLTGGAGLKSCRCRCVLQRGPAVSKADNIAHDYFKRRPGEIYFVARLKNKSTLLWHKDLSVWSRGLRYEWITNILLLLQGLLQKNIHNLVLD